ncbi:P-loop containing nucleoside triphosphate hydrolase protein [Polychytrium aggregatum]|uniref:P-loop containing nucleoside triphosphate hydrolase protein n=1 Tax=Polychytrium aggregatum TaxID=110093 RepID=UPI0022FE8684|nr:P-loop containing nucleoside triphosphate hydrolase protein [Polychytrium aggregatum]KAI9204489.1 P-loop containing nucleoside triphosphate hydrolase protein [Polychytrium aggregatum]
MPAANSSPPTASGPFMGIPKLLHDLEVFSRLLLSHPSPFSDIECRLLAKSIIASAAANSPLLCVESLGRAHLSDPTGIAFDSTDPLGPSQFRTISVSYAALKFRRIMCVSETGIFHTALLPSSPTRRIAGDGGFGPVGQRSSTLTIQIEARPGPETGLFVGWLFLILEDSTIVARPLCITVVTLVDHFPFDVYSKPFIPGFLLDINALPAMKRVGFPPPGPLPDLYRSQITPPQALGPVIQSSLRRCDYDPSLSNYSLFFNNLIRLVMLELEVRKVDIQSFNLYAVPISKFKDSDNLYEIVVQGLNERSWYIAIGDIARIRRVPFDGVEFEAYVYSLHRRTNRVFVQLPFQPEPTAAFNVVFDFGSQYMQSMIASINRISNWVLECKLRDDERGDTYLTEIARSLLFPGLEDGQESVTDPWQIQLELFDEMLNWEQQKAVQLIVDRSYGNVPFVIWGPPGTGKTKTLIETILQILNRHPDSHLLVCAPSHSACDTITHRLIPRLGPDKLFRFLSSQRLFNEVPQPILPYCHSTSNYFDIPPIAKFMSFQVVVATCQDAFMLLQAGLSNRDLAQSYVSYHSNLHLLWPHLHPVPDPFMKPHWSHLLIDEAGQASEAETMIPLSCVTFFPPNATHARSFSPCQVVLCGDHMQLGPMVRSKDARDGRFHISWLERCMASELYRNHLFREQNPGSPLERSPKSAEKKKRGMYFVPPFVNLVKNYRSHPSILMMPSHMFYNNTLEACASESVTTSLQYLSFLPNPKFPIQFIGVDGLDCCNGENASWWNGNEISKVVEVIESILQESNQRSLVDFESLTLADFGVISPFREQVYRIREVLRSRGLGAIDVGRIEDYQGMERKVIILSTVRSRKRFLQEDIDMDLGVVHFPKRLNVAITRSMSLLVVIGNPNLLAVDRNWRRLIEFYLRNKVYTGSAPPIQSKLAAEAEAEVEAESGGGDSGDGDGDQLASVTSQMGTLELSHNLHQKLQNLPGGRVLGGGLQNDDDIMWMTQEGTQEILESILHQDIPLE